MVAHQIRNRLTLIVGTSKGLTRLLTPGAPGARGALNEAEQIRRLERIEAAAWPIDELLDHGVSGAEGRTRRPNTDGAA